MLTAAKEGNAIKRNITTPAAGVVVLTQQAWQDVGESFDRFCVMAGIAPLFSMLETDATALCGLHHSRARIGRTITGAARREGLAISAALMPIECVWDGGEAPPPSSAATSRVGAMPTWRCAGAPPV
jgi:hypothetical protein